MFVHTFQAKSNFLKKSYYTLYQIKLTDISSFVVLSIQYCYKPLCYTILY